MTDETGSGFLSDLDDDDDSQTVVVEGENEEAQEIEAVEESDGPGVVELAGSPQDVAGLYERFEDIKDEVLTSNDITPIGNGVHVNKSGWRKIATAFNVSAEVQETMVEETDAGVLTAEVVVEASAPNGKTVSGTARCSSNESNFTRKLVDENAGFDKAKEDADKYVPGEPDNGGIILVDGWWRLIKRTAEVNEHNLVATAETRAKNRAISDLVGGGEVSAEELTADDVLE